MRKQREFDFARARRTTPAETEKFRKAIERTFHVKRPRRGRPPKGPDKYREISIRLHPRALEWAQAQARRRGIGYQTVINETLLHQAP